MFGISSSVDKGNQLLPQHPPPSQSQRASTTKRLSIIYFIRELILPDAYLIQLEDFWLWGLFMWREYYKSSRLAAQLHGRLRN